MKSRLFWVVMILGLTSLACYSDSPLWVNELTPAPPTITPLPSPASPTRLQRGDLAWVPASVTEAGFRLELTTDPSPLKSDLSNQSRQPCTQNTLIQILYSGESPNGTIYHLIDCNGVVGWTPEDRLLGPLKIVVNDRALTTEAGLDEANMYKIEASDPPYRQDDPFRQKYDCKLNDTVDVIGLAGFSTGELYYKIRCQHPFNPTQRNIGWVLPEALFGPVRFRNGEIGLVPQEYPLVSLTSEPNGTEVIGTCPQGERAQITTTPVQQIDEQLFYEFTCQGVTGWSSQNFLVGPIIYDVGTQVLITAPNVTNSAEAQNPPIVEEATTSAATLTVTTTPSAEVSLPPSVPLTAEPAPFLGDNQVGACADATPVIIQALSGLEEEVYAQIDCEGVLGWVNTEVLFGPVNYAVNDRVFLGEDALLGFGEKGIYLSINLFDIEGGSGGSRVIAGECAFNFETLEPIEAQLVDVGYYRASTGAVAGVFFRAQCTDQDGKMIEGWLNQDRINSEE